MSAFTKLIIESSGTEVVTYLQKLSSNDIDIPVGSSKSTGMQNKNGGYENDCLLVRERPNRYYMIAPTNLETRILNWLEIHKPPEVLISNVTSMFSDIQLIGPKSADLLSELTNHPVNLTENTAYELNIGYACGVVALPYTNTGEPGYSLFIPSDMTIHVHDRLMKVGRDYGIKDIGLVAFRALRIEKFIPYWGEEINSAISPYEIGRGFKVDLNKDDFIGKPALQYQHDHGVTRRMVMFQLEQYDHHRNVWPRGDDPIYRNGVYVGNLTSASYAFTLKKMVGLGFVSNLPKGLLKDREVDRESNYEVVDDDFILGSDAHFEIDVCGERYPATPALTAPEIPVIKLDMMEDKYSDVLDAKLMKLGGGK